MPAFRIYNILRPLGWLYALGTELRNRMYDRGLLKSSSFPIPVISIGNITAGGTGKTPHTEYLAELLKDKFHISVLSRGYGRKTHGYILADDTAGSLTIGDEPFQIKSRFADIDVAVCEDRVNGIKTLLSTRHPQVIILDDAFQHRKVNPSLNILLVDYNRNILDDTLLPAGRLRESAKGRRRADIIIVTKCPAHLTPSVTDELKSKLVVRNEQQIFFSSLEFGNIYHFNGKSAAPAVDCPVLSVTGIANPAPLETELRRTHSIVKKLSFPDHHIFSKRDIAEIGKQLQSMPEGSIIITTTKDAARLSGVEISEYIKDKIYVIPVKPVFTHDSDKFDRTILNHIESFS